MVDTNIRPVQGFKVFSYSGKGSEVKVVIKGAKDDLRTDGDIGDVLKSLELHSTAGESAPVTMSLLHNSDETRTYSQPFIVNTITVKQDDVKVSLNLVIDENNGMALTDVVSSLSIHAENDTDVEVVLARVDT